MVTVWYVIVYSLKGFKEGGKQKTFRNWLYKNVEMNVLPDLPVFFTTTLNAGVAIRILSRKY